MNSLLEVILAVIGTLMVLALAAQAVQEVVKHTFAIKGWTRLTAIKRLVVEATRTAGLGKTDGEDIMGLVIERLRNLSQNGVRKGTVRLDALGKEQLSELIRSADPARVGALKPMDQERGKTRLAEVAAEAVKWFDLAEQPVVDRYRRRMQLGALGAGLAVVLAVNADITQLVRQARTDPAFRTRMITAAGASWSADSALRVLEDSAVRLAADTSAASRTSLAQAMRSARSRRDSLLTAAIRSQDAAFLGYPDGFSPSWMWAIGVLISTLLVSLGAPFWHDILETVFGLKNAVRIRSDRDAATRAANVPARQP